MIALSLVKKVVICESKALYEADRLVCQKDLGEQLELLKEALIKDRELI